MTALADPYAKLRGIIQNANSLQHPAAIERTETPITMPGGFKPMTHDLFDRLDTASRLDNPAGHVMLDGASGPEIERILGQSVKKLGFISVNHAVFEITGAQIFKPTTAFRKARLTEDQTETLATSTFLNRQDSAKRLGITISGFDRAMAAIHGRFEVKNTPQAIRAARQIGYLATLQPIDARKEYFDSIAEKVSILEPSQDSETTEPIESDENLIKRFNNVPPRWISIIDLESQGLTSEAVANRLQIDNGYYRQIKHDLQSRFSASSMNRIVYLACKAGIISSDKSNMLEISKDARMISDKQVNILGLLAKGLTRNQVAEQTGVSLNTVNEHIKTIYIRFYVKSCETAIRVAFEKDIIK